MIKTFDYLRSLEPIAAEVRDAVDRVLHSGRLILGPETEAFESEFAAFVGAEHCIGVTSGTTALHLALTALDMGPGDEVITVANTCAPTIAAIRLTGAEPVFVDVRPEDLMMDPEHVAARISDRTNAIVPVHLWGQSSDLDRLAEISTSHGIPVVEDCAQAHGTTWNGRHVGGFGVAGCFSFYPTKNIGAYGDAGAVVTDDPAVAARLRRLRMYGYEGDGVSVEEGINGRISEIQAAILRVKLRLYPDQLRRRREIAARYEGGIDNSAVNPPHWDERCHPSFHQYVVRCNARDNLATHLREQGVQTAVHYPVPVHRMPAYRELPGARIELPVTEEACERILSLPVHEALRPAESAAVARAVDGFQLSSSR